jgi:heterodisulfide reductase subunit A-like polyferredoxin
MDHDVLVIGGGIGGMESSIKLADMGYKVLLVEKEASVGGRMILLSKVFPTLDCASCISGPKMSSTVNHPNITVKTYSEVAGIRRDAAGRFHATVREKPTFVDWAACTGCDECQTACTVAVPDEFNSGLVARRAAHIAFPQAVPKKAVLDRAGSSPCVTACPAGIKAHGYVSLTRQGRFEEAFQLVLDATPLAGTLGRVCHEFCESSCTHGKLADPLPIRRIKRFVADRHYATADGPGVEVAPANGRSVAVVGSGPAGLTAAWQLARLGYRVRIIEAQDRAGGFLRHALPAYRLPDEVLDQDLANLTAIGVQIVTGRRVEDLQALKDEGYDAVLVATGASRETRLGIPGDDATGVLPGLQLLRTTRGGQAPDVAGRRVLVVGAGEFAADVARTALRLGARDVRVLQRGSRPAGSGRAAAEVLDAEREGVAFEFQLLPERVLTDADGAVIGLACRRLVLGEPGASGRRRLEPASGDDVVVPCDVLVPALGTAPDPGLYQGVVRTGKEERIAVNPRTLQSAVPYLFAAGDVQVGASNVTKAVGSGRRAAHMIDRWLTGRELTGFTALDDRLRTVDKNAVVARQSQYRPRDTPAPWQVPGSRPSDFGELEPPLTEEEALRGGAACLDCGVCSECQECVKACPADAIRMDQRETVTEVEVGAVVVSTGYRLFPADLKPEYGYGRFPNVITGMQMDRLLAPTRPYHTVVRPSDGKVPERIAFISCTGSRDTTVGNPLCSKVCCMYSVKQNQLIMGALPLADVTMHYMDLRAAGKRYDEFYEQAKDMGASYIRGRVSRVTEKDDGDLVLRYEDIDGGGRIMEAEYDLVVLAVGIQPNRDVERLFTDEHLGLDEYFYVAEPGGDLDPGTTDLPGVFVAGAASGAKDIVDSIVHAGAAAAQVVAHLERSRTTAEVLA